MHVDVQSVPLMSAVPIEITFLSVQPDANQLATTCMFNVPATIPGVVTSVGQGSTGYQPSAEGGSGSTSNTSASAGTSTSGTNVSPGIVAATNSLGTLCADGGASRLWIVLLILYAIFVFVLCAQKPDTQTRVKEWNIVLILAVFLGLIIFWYVSAICRAGPWAPALATLIAVAGLLYTTLKQEPQQLLLLKNGEKGKK